MKNVKLLVILSYCSSILIVGKLILLHLPNIEVVTFLLMLYTLVFKFRYALAITLVYSIVEILLWGIQGSVAPLWFIIVLITFLLKRVFKENFLLWALLSGFFGLIFGLMYAVTLFLVSEMVAFLRVIMGLPIDAIRMFEMAAFSRVIMGLPFDAIHMVGNYFIMLFIGKLVYKRLKDLLKNTGGL